MSVDNILLKEVEKNQELREKLLIVGFALQKAKASVEELEEIVHHWPANDSPDILTSILSHIEDVKRELNNVSNCSGENELVSIQPISMRKLAEMKGVKASVT